MFQRRKTYVTIPLSGGLVMLRLCYKIQGYNITFTLSVSANFTSAHLPVRKLCNTKYSADNAQFPANANITTVTEVSDARVWTQPTLQE